MKSGVSLIILLSLPLAGCVAWRERFPVASDVAHERQARKAEAVQAFEQQRDAAQLAAALDRWATGDLAGCEARLRALLARHPGSPAAKSARAEVHHVLGLVLAEQGRLDEARVHLTKAAELAPDADDYRLALEALPTTR